MSYLRQEEDVRWAELPELIPSSDVARILGIDPSTLRGYARAGIIARPVDHRGVGRKSYYRRSDVQSFYEERAARAHQYNEPLIPERHEQEALDALKAAEDDLASYRRITSREIARLERLVTKRRNEYNEVYDRIRFRGRKSQPRAEWKLPEP